MIHEEMSTQAAGAHACSWGSHVWEGCSFLLSAECSDASLLWQKVEEAEEESLPSLSCLPAPYTTRINEASSPPPLPPP